ncbi:MAG TPA: metalloregulator ArsR/SmtB family transcription factor [Steroidobacteraceae bacterium]|nr:metalloregulator ArsR/SmtB family transcription factor [Steroidobacteraceae bacterium]
MVTVEQVLGWLKAASEPTRLRLLVLCAQRDFSVSDLAEVLGQSEPRVSRHLKLLCDAGLLARTRQGQWVHYRLAGGDAAASFVRGLLSQLDRADEVLARDRERARLTSSADAVIAVPTESRLGRALSAFIEANRPAPARAASAVVLGVEQLELLESAATLARDCIAIARSRRAAQAARAFAERRGFACRVLAVNEAAALDEPPRCDALIVNRVATPKRPLAGVLESARRHIASDGRIWLFERYDALDSVREAGRSRVVEHPLARLRRVLAESGFDCQRLVPIEADGEHVLAAVALPASASLVAHAGS